MELLLTLGHNASAILCDKGQIVRGYEEERLTGIKSDSHFPQNAIERCTFLLDSSDITHIYVSHWFLDGHLPEEGNKYWNPIWLASRFPNAILISVNNKFTHHDAHAYSANMFQKYHEKESWIQPLGEDDLVLVMDGFGNFGETMSVYRPNNGTLKLIKRAFGFESSVGLWYQYAIAYLGMKENQDEYKLLGYESHIDELNIDLALLEEVIKSSTKMLLDNIHSPVAVLGKDTDPMLTVEALPNIRLKYKEMWAKHMSLLGIEWEKEQRIAVGYIAQKVTENVVASIVSDYGPERLVVCGGIFMNVKLNAKLARMVEQFTVFPLCGDQGAALGLWHYHNGNLPDLSTLAWGERFSIDDQYLELAQDKGLIFIEREFAAKVAAALLRKNFIVNIVDQNKMEFGARALGNTSTLALPTKDNVEYINACNNRSTVMPMAGVVRHMDIHAYHNADNVQKIAHCLPYMIVTADFHPSITLSGASHRDVDRGVLTGRTQTVAPDNIMHDILTEMAEVANPHPMVINTSFNPHGRPIPYTADHILFAHRFMKANDYDRRVVTIIYTDNKE